GFRRRTTRRQARGERARADGTTAPRPIDPRGPAVQRRRAPADLRPPRRELRLARLRRRRHAPDRGPTDLCRAPAPARPGNASRAPAQRTARRATEEQPRVPERGLREARRAGPPRPLRARPRLPSRPRRVRRRAAPNAARRTPRRGLPRALDRHPPT